MGNNMIPFPDKKYQIIYADPPWYYKNYADDTASRWVGNQYNVMSVEDICGLPVQNISDVNCLLFLWVTPPCLLDGLKVLQSWGFNYKTKAFCWIKKNVKSDNLFLGMGYWTRSNSEDCLLGVKGHPKRISASVRQVVENKWLGHSVKPPIIRDKIIELVGDLPRIELFARQRTPGWDVWGNEISINSRPILPKL